VFKKSIIITAICTAAFTSAAHANKADVNAGAKSLAAGYGYAMTIQERCLGRTGPVEKERRTTIRRIAESILKTNKADIKAIDAGLVEGVKTARRVDNPTPAECRDADDIMEQLNVM